MSLGCLTVRGFRMFCAAQNLQRVAPVLLVKCHSNRTDLSCQKRWLHTSMPAFQQGRQDAEESSAVWNICHDTVVDGVSKHLITLIDVRKPEEINELGSIPTAKNIPVDEVETALQLSGEAFEQKYNFPKPSPDGPPIVTYCKAGIRSARACRIFRHFNYYNVGNYHGSWNEWSEKHPEDVRVQPVRDK